MPKRKCWEVVMICVLRQKEAGRSAGDVGRRGVSKHTICASRAKHGEMSAERTCCSGTCSSEDRSQFTVKLKAEELFPPGLVTVTVQVPPSLALLNAGSTIWLEETKFVLWLG